MIKEEINENTHSEIENLKIKIVELLEVLETYQDIYKRIESRKIYYEDLDYIIDYEYNCFLNEIYNHRNKIHNYIVKRIPNILKFSYDFIKNEIILSIHLSNCQEEDLPKELKLIYDLIDLKTKDAYYRKYFPLLQQLLQEKEIKLHYYKEQLKELDIDAYSKINLNKKVSCKKNIYDDYCYTLVPNAFTYIQNKLNKEDKEF